MATPGYLCKYCGSQNSLYHFFEWCPKQASMVKLVDTPDLKSDGEIHTGSIPVAGTKPIVAYKILNAPKKMSTTRYAYSGRLMWLGIQKPHIYKTELGYVCSYRSYVAMGYPTAQEAYIALSTFYTLQK